MNICLNSIWDGWGMNHAHHHHQFYSLNYILLFIHGNLLSCQKPIFLITYAGAGAGTATSTQFYLFIYIRRCINYSHLTINPVYCLLFNCCWLFLSLNLQELFRLEEYAIVRMCKWREIDRIINKRMVCNWPEVSKFELSILHFVYLNRVKSFLISFKSLYPTTLLNSSHQAII